MATELETLRTRISELRCESLDQRSFFCQADIKALLTRDCIEKAIPECHIPDHKRQRVAKTIEGEMKTIFAILVWKRWQHLLVKFIDHCIVDSQLPLGGERAQQVVGLQYAEDFTHRAQWEFLPRMLTKEMSGCHYYLRDEEVLPFVSEVSLGSGSFGEVFKVSVSPSMQTMFDKPGSEVLIVRKCPKLDQPLKPNQRLRDAKYWERERECLEILHYLKHPNIVELLGSYTYKGIPSFLFPLFPMDLEEFLQHKERYGDFKNDRVFFEALKALSSALETVHYLNTGRDGHDLELARIGYHHDLRPANVLVNTKTFYLADFGLGRVKPEDLGDSRTKWKKGLGDYVAPECIDENLEHNEVGRPLDIWAFGCMIFEIVAYMKGGPHGLQDYRRQRKGPGRRSNMTDCNFFSTNPTGSVDRLRPSVTQWFEKGGNQGYNGALQGLLSVACRMLEIEPTRRPKAAEAQDYLSFLNVKVLSEVLRDIFEQYRGEISDRAEEVAVTYQLASKRFHAWCKALRLDGNVPSADELKIMRNKGDEFSSRLVKLLDEIDSLPKKLSEKDEEPRPGTEIPIRQPVWKVFEELIEHLSNSLPNELRDRQTHILEEDLLITNDGEFLRNIESNTESSELQALASKRRGNILLNSSEDGSIEHRNPPLDLDSLRMEGLEDTGHGLYRGRPVFVERVRESDDKSQERRQQRIHLLANALYQKGNQGSPHILNCLGFVHLKARDECRPAQQDYGIVFSYPLKTSGQSTPRRLVDMLSSRKETELPLGEKFRTAYRIVSCIRQLHIAGWLHKNISSKNIFFFNSESPSGSAETLENAYLVGFCSTRPSGKDWQTVSGSRAIQENRDSLSKHPDYTIGKQPFCEIHDYYSLGIALLELGSWAPLEKFIKHQDKPLDPLNFRNLLVTKYAPRLSSLMGNTYRDATLACLRGDFDAAGTESNTGKTMLGGFYDKVVAPLGKLSQYSI